MGETHRRAEAVDEAVIAFAVGLLRQKEREKSRRRKVWATAVTQRRPFSGLSAQPRRSCSPAWVRPTARQKAPSLWLPFWVSTGSSSPSLSHRKLHQRTTRCLTG